MSVKSWTITAGSETHRVDLDWSYWGGKRQVNVDGKVVSKNTVPMRWKSTQEFAVDGHECVVVTEPQGKKKFTPIFQIWLKVDGKLVESDTDPVFWETKKDFVA